MKTTEETSGIEKFLLWRLRNISEHPDWIAEPRRFFVDLYVKTYPARTFGLLMELFAHRFGKELGDGEPRNPN